MRYKWDAQGSAPLPRPEEGSGPPPARGVLKNQLKIDELDSILLLFEDLRVFICVKRHQGALHKFRAGKSENRSGMGWIGASICWGLQVISAGKEGGQWLDSVFSDSLCDVIAPFIFCIFGLFYHF